MSDLRSALSVFPTETHHQKFNQQSRVAGPYFQLFLVNKAIDYVIERNNTRGRYSFPVAPSVVANLHDSHKALR
jgi:hypothetical protein